MKESDIDLKDQCEYCQRSWNTSHCTELKSKIKEEYGFHCPFFIFDESVYDEEYKQRIFVK